MLVTLKSRRLPTNRQRWTRSRDSCLPFLSVINVSSFSPTSFFLSQSSGRPASVTPSPARYCSSISADEPRKVSVTFQMCASRQCTGGRKPRTIEEQSNIACALTRGPFTLLALFALTSSLFFPFNVWIFISLVAFSGWTQLLSHYQKFLEVSKQRE